MLRGAKVGLRAREERDVLVLHAGLYEDVATRMRADSRPWRPVPPTVEASPYRAARPSDEVAVFSVVDLAGERLVGEALLWAIDTHNRSAHLGISLLPEARGRGLGADVVGVLCSYGFLVRGLHRLQVDTLADNASMIRAATHQGFAQEGRLRRAAWVEGRFVDEVILGLLADDWRDERASPTPAGPAS